MAILVSTYDNTATARASQQASLETIAIFGASGTAGDGILKAALANPNIRTIQYHDIELWADVARRGCCFRSYRTG